MAKKKLKRYSVLVISSNGEKAQHFTAAFTSQEAYKQVKRRFARYEVVVQRPRYVVKDKVNY